MKNNMMEMLKSEENFKTGYEMWESMLGMGIIPDTSKDFMKTSGECAEDQMYGIGAIMSVYNGIDVYPHGIMVKAEGDNGCYMFY